MQSADREEFEAQAKMLFAGHNVPVTRERLDAYWTGLSKMPLSGFVRVVEYALGEDGPERIPTVPQLWKVYKTVRNPAPARTGAAVSPHAAIMEKVNATPGLSIWQLGQPWHWIVRWSPGVDHAKVAVAEYGAQFLGVVIPICPKEPGQHPSVRVML